MITIKSKHEPYYRCGVAHSRAGTQFAQDAFTPEQWERLRNDPRLIVVDGDTDNTESLAHAPAAGKGAEQAPVASVGAEPADGAPASAHAEPKPAKAAPDTSAKGAASANRSPAAKAKGSAKDGKGR